MLCGSLFQKEKNFFLSIEISAISLKCELIKLFEEKELLRAKCHTRMLLEERKDYLLSEARSELETKELRVEGADSSG